jgi:hypothetical protein
LADLEEAGNEQTWSELTNLDTDGLASLAKRELAQTSSMWVHQEVEIHETSHHFSVAKLCGCSSNKPEVGEKRRPAPPEPW